MPNTTWGKWSINTQTGCLEISITNTAMPYQVMLKECGTSAEQLDWIFQISEKSWSTTEDVGNLVDAFREIFGRRVASMGKNNPIDAQTLVNEKYSKPDGSPVFP